MVGFVEQHCPFTDLPSTPGLGGEGGLRLKWPGNRDTGIKQVAFDSARARF